MEQARFGRSASPDDVFEVAGLVAFDLGRCIAITLPGYQYSGIDDQRAEFFEALPEAGQQFFGRPDIGSGQLGILGICSFAVVWRAGSVVEVVAIDVEGALECVV